MKVDDRTDYDSPAHMCSQSRLSEQALVVWIIKVILVPFRTV